jgi:hypothetical protein
LTNAGILQIDEVIEELVAHNPEPIVPDLGNRLKTKERVKRLYGGTTSFAQAR